MARREAKVKRATSATGDRGFTLLELLVVLTIIVLLASAWPLAYSHFFMAQRLRNETQVLAGTIREAQMTARVTGTPQELTISPEATSYTTLTENHDLPEGMTLRLRNGVGSSTQQRMIVFSDGSSSGGMLELALSARVATLQVQRITGRIEMQP
jgi:prepilin-type N-terminal cleavage/methylation domain-containing protein